MSVQPGCANPIPLVSSSCLHPFVVPLPRQGFFPASHGKSRQLGAKYDKLSSRIPASDGVEKYLLPERARRERTRTFHPKPLPTHPRTPSAVLPSSLPKRFLSFRLPLSRTRLFAGLRYLHKSAMQSLFIFRAKVWREYTRDGLYERKYYSV